MELNKKHLDIMAYLRAKEDYVSIEELADQYGLSVRGIRYNLDKIEQYMVSRGLPYLERERTRGVRLSASPEVYEFVDRCAGELRSFQYSYSAEERQAFLRFILLLAVQPVRIEDLCHSLDRSRNTMFKDLERTEEWLKQHDLVLVKRPRVGLFCEGDEFTRRQLATQIVMQSVNPNNLLHYATTGAELKGKAELLLVKELLPVEVAAAGARAVKRLETLLDRPFSDDSFSELLVRLAIIFRRGYLGYPLNLSDPNADYIPMTSEYAAARLVLDELEPGNQLLPEDEVRYFTYCLLGAKVMRPYVPVDPKVEDQPLLEVTRKMIADISRIYDVDFGDQYNEIEQAIFLHLKPAAHRLRFGMYNHNPLYSEIVSNYNALFINTRIVCHHLEEYLRCPMNDHEVSFIALHFGAALHRVNLRTTNKARVLLVCGTGLGSAQMITAQIEKLFNVEVVGTVSGRKAMAMDKTGIDHIITTVPLPLDGDTHCIQVSPMFDERDQQKIAEFLSLRFVPKEHYDLEVFTVNRLLSIIEKYCVVNDRLHLQYELLNELMTSPPAASLAPAPQGNLSLCDLLTRDRINTVNCSDDWREAIRASAALLEGQGVIAPSYKESIIRNLEQFGPYMVMLPGIALAHAAPEEGANGLGISMSLLSTPVHFGYKAHDPVNIIVMLSAKDEKTHLNALAQLFRMFKDANSLRTILRGNKEDILQCIARHSN
ncbi:MAG: BglG family transcription antiterminator [Oscillospiraceae bacterium]|nr:BglG family transcription antiterminator [Oscillospiraceae bacterium]